jgi:protease-4
MATYYETGDFLGAPPATFREGLLGYANPALPTLAGDHLVTAWTTDGREAASLRDWGVFGSLRGLGAGVVRRRPGALRLTGYHLSLSGGDEDAAFGVGYQGFAGDATALGRYNRLRFGSIARPVKYLSVGLTGTVALETDDREVVGEIGVRPLGTSRLTLFADAAWGEGQALVDVPWSAGASVEVVDGIDLRGRVLDGETVSIGLRVGLGRGGLDSQSRIDTEGEYGGQTNRLRLGDYTPSRIAERGRAGEEHVEVSLQGPVRYQEATFAGLFGDVPPRFYEVLRTIDQSAEEERVAAVALNLSGLQVQPELAWELREAVREAQERGVTVVAFLENGGMTSYHLASVADQVVLDPQGTLTLPGYAAGRTFVKGTLEKLGLGVQAWRFFEYKSAFERFSRTDYSRADSLQRKAYVDDQYELARADVAGSRPVSPDSLDRLIDEKTLLTATEARQAGLVDTLARWAGRETVLKRAVGEETASLDADALDQIATASRRWGAPDEVALVYGIGATQVEQGMNSRSLSEKLRGLAEDDDVAAVVFRVDSPGGSPVAADQVAAALRKCAEKKPVVVSQGQVAGSGGYWVSAYADTIVAGPNTVTGSIGVIGGWIYDETFSEKTGLTSDVVQRGARADLLKGIRLPLVGLSVPTRKLTEEELARVETVIRTQYDQFVDVVAEGRDTTTAHVRDVGAGRIYSGRAGRDVGLVDEVGGVRRALELARQAAGLPADEVQIREVNPESGTFDVGQLLPGLLGTLVEDPTEPQPAAQADPTGTFLRLMLEHQPGPLVLLPPGTIPAGE